MILVTTLQRRNRFRGKVLEKVRKTVDKMTRFSFQRGSVGTSEEG